MLITSSRSFDLRTSRPSSDRHEIPNIGNFTFAFNFLNVLKLIIILVRPIILYSYFKKISIDSHSKIIYLIIIADIIPSLLLYDNLLLIDFFKYLIGLF